MAITGVTPTPALNSTTGRLAALQDEGAAGRADIQDIACTKLRAQVSAGDSVRFLLNGDAITTGVRQIGQRVAAQDGRRVSFRTESQHHELPGQRDRQRTTVHWLQHQ